MTGLAWGHGRALTGTAAHRAPRGSGASGDPKAPVTSARTNNQEVGLLPGGNVSDGAPEEALDRPHLKKAHPVAAQTQRGGWGASPMQSAAPTPPAEAQETDRGGKGVGARNRTHRHGAQARGWEPVKGRRKARPLPLQDGGRACPAGVPETYHPWEGSARATEGGPLHLCGVPATWLTRPGRLR